MQRLASIARSLPTALLLYLGSAAIAASLDPAVESAPAWFLDRDASHVIWKSAIGGESGALAYSQGKFVVSASTRWTTPAAGQLPQNSGAVACIDQDGKPLWEARHARIGQRIHDMGQPIRSRACIDGSRAYYISNRGELACVDLEGFRDGRNDGPFKVEEQSGLSDADFLWKIDMPAELGVYKREASDVGNPVCSPLVIGELVFCVTGHGRPAMGGILPALANPGPPSFLAVHKLTGKVAWSSNAPGRSILLGQWASPVHARIAGIDNVIFPGGDGCLYGFEAVSGKLLWKLDCNEPGAVDWINTGVYWENPSENKKKFFVASPVVESGTLYVGLNLDYESPRPSPLLAVDLTAPAPVIKWKFQSPEFGSTYSSAAVADGIVYTTGQEGTLFALDAESGIELWRSHFEDERVLYSSPVISDGKVCATGSSSIVVFAAGPEKNCLGRYEFERANLTTPFAVNGRLFVAAGDLLWALRLPDAP